MNAADGINLAYVATLVVSAVGLLRLCRTPRPTKAQRAAAVRALVGQQVVHDVGPDALRLLQDLDAHLDQYSTQLAGLYERVGSPDLDAGCDRLREAIRDEQNRGNQ